MIVYEIKIFSQPKIKFASSSTTDNYKNYFYQRTNIIEIATIENSSVMYEYDNNEKYEYKPDSMILIMPDMICKSYMLGENSITVDSIGMEINDFKYIKHKCSDDEMCAILKNCGDLETLFIPACFELGDDYQQFSAMVKSLINYYIKNTSSGYYKCLSIWYELLSFIDLKFRESIMPIDNNDISSYYYVNKARKYILSHIDNKIKISDIAADLNITPNYLSNIFKIGTGKTIIDYINSIRVQKIRELMYNEEKSILEIISSVGLHDIRYVQKLFKKYYGMSMRRCKQIDHEISLYHQKPWEVESLNHDIFFETIN